MSYLPHALLAALSIVGILGLHYLGNNDGLFPLLEDMGKAGVYPVNFTSIQSVKDLSTTLLGFFYPAVDGTHPALSLACYFLFGQLFTGWAVLMVEGSRAGNRMRATYFTSALGIAFQVIGGAVVIPAWLLMHLLTSSTVTKPTTSSITVAKQTLAATPWAVLVGALIPTVLASLPTPSFMSVETKINAILFWQLFPVWTNLLQMVFGYLALGSQRLSQAEQLRLFYSPIIALGAVTHISALTLATSAYLIPRMYSPDIGPQLSQALFAFPPHPFSDARITSAGEGALWFIQYDCMICSWAFLIWSVKLRAAVWERADVGEWASRIGSIVLRSVLLGPVTASAKLVWERDLAVLEAENGVGSIERKKRA